MSLHHTRTLAGSSLRQMFHFRSFKSSLCTGSPSPRWACARRCHCWKKSDFPDWSRCQLLGRCAYVVVIGLLLKECFCRCLGVRRGSTFGPRSGRWVIIGPFQVLAGFWGCGRFRLCLLPIWFELLILTFDLIFCRCHLRRGSSP